MTLLETPFEIVASHPSPVQTVRSSPDGRWILTGDTMRNLRVWKDGELAYELALKTKNAKAATSDRLRSICFSPDGESFYVASGTNVQAFSTETGSKSWSFSLPRFLGFLVSVPLSLDVDSEGRIATSSDDGAFGYRDDFGRRMRQWKHNAAPRWIRWMDSGRSLIGSDSFSIRLWDSGTGETIRGFTTSERVYNLESSPNGLEFAVRTLHSVQVYSLESATAFAEIPTLEGLPLLAFSKDGSCLAIGNSDGARIVSVRNESETGVAEVLFEARLPAGISALALDFSSEGSLLIGCSDGQVRSTKVTS